MSEPTPELGMRGARLSADGRYRYRLWRFWDLELPIMVWVLLNPSTADADTDDPTLRKCIGFAKAHHHGGVILVNLFAYRATNPKELPKAVAPIGPENDEHIKWACQAPILATVVAGWGSDRFAQKRARTVTMLLRTYRRQIHCFRKSKAGVPWHPLYLPYSCPLETL